MRGDWRWRTDRNFRAQIARHGLQDCVSLLGELPQAEVMRHMRDAAAFVAPCIIASNDDRDGLPTVLTEAMALGTPCISTDVTGIPELVRDGETGLQVPQRNPLALADAIECLLDDAAFQQRLAANARILIEAEFDVNQNAAALRDIWRVAVESKHSKTTPKPIDLVRPVAPSTPPSAIAPVLAEVMR
ncbi:MAG: glycosyltransferase [Anaerolineae bacterium]|nr:glycosyltransferase [Anaerolineae bacterium]